MLYNYFTPIQIFPLVSMIFILFLGVIILSKNKDSLLNKLFFIISLLFSVWLFGSFMMFISIDDEKIVFWDRFIYLGVAFMPAVEYHFSLVFTYINRTRKKLLIVAYALSFLFLFFSRTKYFVDKVFKYQWGVHSEAKILHHFFLIFFFFYIFALLFNFYQQYKSNNNRTERHRLIYLTVSFAILNLVGGIGYLPAYKIAIYSPVSLLAPLAFSILIACAIIRHRLMDIKLVLRKSSVYISSLLTILMLSLSAQYFLKYLDLTSRYVDFIILVLSISLFSPIKHYFYRLANRYFFTSLYDAKQVIAELSDKLRKSLELKKIYGYVVDSLMNSFHSKSLAIFIFEEKNRDYAIKFEKGFAFGARKKFSEDELLHDLYVKQNNLIIIEELKNTSYKKYKKEIDLLAEMKIELIMPLNVKDRNIGLIVLGPKESGDMYNDEDLQVLQIVGAQAAIAVENALSYERMKNFNAKLKKEVETATAELRTANKKLVELDETKSEFISIASHQLRTPLTVIKGYISMMIEGSFGPLTDAENDSLKKVYESNERLIQLVENLLDISRIESGRLEFNFKEDKLESVVESVVEELKHNAEDKNLKLEYKKPAKSLPKIVFDEQKIRQVIMNLIDNAIKYTKQGKISVEIGAQGRNLNFSVTDTGMGVSPDDLPNLFMKFSRGKGVSLVHTGGNGLGLYVGRMMVEAHCGKIWGESAGVGKGAKFCFSLPIRVNLKTVNKKEN